MRKDYTNWHHKKEIINDIEHPPFFREGQIWHCHLGANIGHEQDGKGESFLRPVVIIKKFSSQTLWVIPLTKLAGKIPWHAERYYFSVSFSPDTKSEAILSQLCTIDARRLKRNIGELDKKSLRFLIEKIKALLP